jgi:glycosyltransferase involved in cell wall biosynthesis
MRVLMTADAVGGVWSYAMDLANVFANRCGIETVLAVLGPAPSPAQQRQAAMLQGLQLEIHPGRLEWMSDAWADVEADGEWLLALEAASGADVVHLNGYAHGALPFVSPTVVVAHSCVLSWWQAVKGVPAPRQWRRYRHAVARGLAGADAVVAPSRAMAAEVERLYRPRQAVEVIANGRDPGAFAPAAKRNLVLCAGRLWDEAKNLTALCAAAPALAWPVFVAGETSPDTRCASVRLLGQLSTPALARWYARAAIYALPARYEPFGLSALEAGLSGCALVLGDVPSLRDIWAAAAVFVDPADDRALAEVISWLIAHPETRAQMQQRALRRARRFDIAGTADAYRSLYTRLVTPAPERVPACAS